MRYNVKKLSTDTCYATMNLKCSMLSERSTDLYNLPEKGENYKREEKKVRGVPRGWGLGEGPFWGKGT